MAAGIEAGAKAREAGACAKAARVGTWVKGRGKGAGAGPWAKGRGVGD